MRASTLESETARKHKPVSVDHHIDVAAYQSTHHMQTSADIASSRAAMHANQDTGIDTSTAAAHLVNCCANHPILQISSRIANLPAHHHPIVHRI
ncbi:MAG: hypothetical protein EOO38_31255 [Cytophagaceae bacterium]|nr:MAG: hypothetical protein EOO38_31255 [Cytophagaceae bacterium]